MGPTAAGKTAAAMHLADQMKARLISVDSALIYRHMDIGTAKPTAQELQAYPHGLIDIIDPHESYSVAQFIADSTAEIHQAHANNQLPILVGGTMLYFKGLVQGLAPTPSSDPVIRAQIQAELAQHEPTYGHQWLTQVDPQSAARLHNLDSQRIERALEIFLSSGKKMSDQYDPAYFQKGWDTQSLLDHQWDILPVALAPTEKKQLHPLIEQRFNTMIENGFLDEMRKLMESPHISAETPSMRCVGYRQAWAHLIGETSFDQFQEQSKAATRQLAKRQMTWLRNWSTPHWLDSFAPDCHSKLHSLVQDFHA